MDNPLILGIDIGSTRVKGVVFSPVDGVRQTFLQPIQGRMLEPATRIIRDALSAAGRGDLPVFVTGAGARLVWDACPGSAVNELIATARGLACLCPGVTDLVEVGGQFSKWLRADGAGVLADYAMNELCAAGSGCFLEQQASRLHIGVADLAALAAQAPQGAAIAGRCSVFAKSDMIHLQQKGTPLDEIAYGLCLAVTRNFVATIVKGRDLREPVAYIGGCATNPGLVRAFRETLGLDDAQFFVPRHFEYVGAIGACLGTDQLGAEPDALLEALGKRETASREEEGRLAPLRLSFTHGPRQEPCGAGSETGVTAFLGADVGSVSTDLALVAPNGEVLHSIYLATRGRPLTVLREALEEVHARYGDRLSLLGIGVTGSGRHLAGRFIGADVVKNEITAQLVSASACFLEVDTIFEIGGQDSKYISVQDGRVRDFTMNKVCAAGTGSFLEEQAERLGIDIIGEFAEMALAGHAPADLGNRCTVFMDSELVAARQRGISLGDIAAGLAYAVAKNYLEKVVDRRHVGGKVGIPWATFFHELLPLWADFFQRLGYEVALSSPSSPALFANRHSPLTKALYR